jgi:hypothetical protein
VAHAVEVAGVEQIDAGVERGMDRGDALGAVGGAVEVGHPHAAQPEDGDLGAGGTERAGDHDEKHTLDPANRARADPDTRGWI